MDTEYGKRKARFEVLLQRQKKVIAYISILRLLLIAGTIYFIVLAVRSGYDILLVPAGLMVVMFFVFVSYHKNQHDKKRLLEELIAINDEEAGALRHDFSSFRGGEQFIDPGHPWSYDLDLFGERSLYQSLNRTATHTGPEKLAEYLGTPVTDEKEFGKRQAVIRELAEKINLRQHFTAHARMMDTEEQDLGRIIEWSAAQVFVENKRWTKILPVIMTFVSAGIITAGIFHPPVFRLLVPVVLLNLSLLSPFFTRTGRYQEQVSKKHRFLRTYSTLLEIIAAETFDHPRLRRFCDDSQDASRAIRQLSSMLNLFDQRLNILVGFTLNALMLFDFFMLHRLASWNRRHREDLVRWLDIAGESDALFSLAGFAFNHPGYTYPGVRNDHTGLKAVQLGHPMIPDEKRVDNSLTIDNERVVLITGANMAGKSTFLRSVGVNMVLAYAGCPVCAAEFVTGPYHLFSGMRTSDSLKDEESYFFAEIKRLKKIVDRMEGNEKLLILLDEVLKGTNTTDKQKGTRGLIERAIGHDVLCFIATHDLSLGEMQEAHPGKIVNYCFESYIEELELHFDYTIRPGLAKNMNASFLMKKMGIMR